MKTLTQVSSAFLVSILMFAGCQRTIEADLVIKEINVINVETGDVLEATLLDDINNIKTTWGTVINGQLYDRNKLDGLLAAIKIEVKVMK